MNELIKINYDGTTDKATVSGRELHDALGIETPYHKWFTTVGIKKFSRKHCKTGTAS